ncbi:MAG: hypothetical protein CMO57_01490 [Verrucomicrobiales bacterium]|nr:hypothetical protein [Verrucomicrobiales bacterium]|tara:strand:+ start:2606 stop:3094 length:489 start_codon:yes stop_codon:yes gene_type:complete
MAKKFKAEIVSGSPDDYPKKTNTSSGSSAPNNLSDKFEQARKHGKHAYRDELNKRLKEAKKEAAKIKEARTSVDRSLANEFETGKAHEQSSVPEFFQNKDGTTNWGYIILLICMFSCCLIPQCGGGGSTGPNLPSESEWNRMTPEEKGKRIADEAMKEVYGR